MKDRDIAVYRDGKMVKYLAHLLTVRIKTKEFTRVMLLFQEK